MASHANASDRSMTVCDSLRVRIRKIAKHHKVNHKQYGIRFSGFVLDEFQQDNPLVC